MSLNNPNKKNDLLAYFCAFTAQTIFPFANLYAIQHNFSISQINIIRSIMVIVLSLFIAHTSNVDLNYALKYSFKQLFVRNVISVGWILALTWSLYYLSLAVIFSINITGSLSIFVWDTYVYNIGINRHQKIGVLLGVIGALLVINANYFLSLIDPNFKMHTDFQYFKSKSISDTVFSASILLIANIAQGYAFSITKSIKIQKSGCQYNLSFGFMMLAFSAIGIMFQTERQPKPWGTYFAVLLLSGVPLTAATQIFSTGLSLSNNTGILALFMTVSVLVSYLIGFYRYHQGFNLFAFVGSVLIIAGISMTIIMKTAPK